MNIVTEPKVHVLSVPRFIPHPEYKIPEDGNDIIKLGAQAAKVCYHSFGEYGRPNLKNQESIVSSRHGSVLEHANISLLIEGITRGCSLEIVRHRAGFAYSQRSTRYTDESDCTVVAEPELASLIHLSRKGRELRPGEYGLIWNFEEACKESFTAYKHAVDLYLEMAAQANMTGTKARKYARGKARDLLPHALETKMVVTGNIRAWRHFLEMRSAAGAEAEIRRLSNYVHDALMPHIAFYLRDYEATLVEGFYEYTTQYAKV